MPNLQLLEGPENEGKRNRLPADWVRMQYPDRCACDTRAAARYVHAMDVAAPLMSQLRIPKPGEVRRVWPSEPACFQPGQRGRRKESERFHRFSYDELVDRDKASLDIFWLRDESLEDTDNLPSPGVIAAEIVEDLQAALAEFTELAESLQSIGVSIESEE